MGISQNKNGTYLPCQFSGYGIYQGYPKKYLVHKFYQFFWDMEYSWDIPKNSGTYVFSVFLGYGIFKGYPQKFTVYNL